MARSAAAAGSRHKTGSRGGCGKASTSRRYAGNFPSSALRRAITSRNRRRRSAGAPLQTGSLPEGRSGRPRSATIAALKCGALPERCARASWVAYHQQGGAVRRFDQTIAAKSGLLIGAYRVRIGGVGIGDDARRSVVQQPINKATDECRAMTPIYHVRFSDELVDASGALRMAAQSVIRPNLGIVTLQISEGSIILRHNELIHGLDLEVAADNLELFVSIAPPLHHVRFRQPALHQRQIGLGHWTKHIGGLRHRLALQHL